MSKTNMNRIKSRTINFVGLNIFFLNLLGKVKYNVGKEYLQWWVKIHQIFRDHSLQLEPDQASQIHKDFSVSEFQFEILFLFLFFSLRFLHFYHFYLAMFFLHINRKDRDISKQNFPPRRWDIYSLGCFIYLKTSIIIYLIW